MILHISESDAPGSSYPCAGGICRLEFTSCMPSNICGSLFFRRTAYAASDGLVGVSILFVFLQRLSHSPSVQGPVTTLCVVRA
eukprot:9482580-Pyramimonas_sp.AAC.1